MKLVQKYPILGSSYKPGEISLRIKSMGVMIITLIVAVGKFFQLDFAEEDLTQFVQSLAFIVGYVGFWYGHIRSKKDGK